jgi:hypothetical protein
MKIIAHMLGDDGILGAGIVDALCQEVGKKLLL